MNARHLYDKVMQRPGAVRAAVSALLLFTPGTTPPAGALANPDTGPGLMLDVAAVSSGAGSDESTDSLVNVGQSTVGVAAGGSITLHAGVIPSMVLGSEGPACTITWTGDGDGTSWHDTDNWDPSRAPGAADDVCIPDVLATALVAYSSGTTDINSVSCDEHFQMSGGTLTVSAESAFQKDFAITYGTLSGTGNVTVTGLTTWDAGAIVGTNGTETITANGGLELGSVYEKNLDGRTLNYTGNANWTDGNIQLKNDAVWNVGSGNTFNAQADTHQVYGSGTFNNAGELTVNVAGYVRFSWDTLNFVNTGSLDIQNGELELRNTSSHTGATITVASGALLDFAYYTHDLDQDTTVDAAEVAFSGATVNIAGTYALTGSSTTVSGGQVNFTGSIPNGLGDLVISGGTANLSNTEGVVSADTLTQTYGTLTGTSDVIITGLTTWDGGAIVGTNGTETITANGGLELGGVYEKNLDGRTLHYTGTANWTDGNIQLKNDAVWNVGAGNAFNAQADGHQVYGTGTFNNVGDFTVSVANYVRLVWDTLNFVNTGSLDIQAGELEFRNTSSHTDATITVAGGGLLDFAQYTHDLYQGTTVDATEVSFSGATVSIAGTYTLTGSSTTVSGGQVNFTGSIPNGVGDLVITGGTANFSNIEGLVSADTLTQTWGTLTGTSDVIVTGLTTWDGGAIEGTNGTETITANSGLAMGSNYQKNLDGRTLDYIGTANWTSGSIELENDAVWNVGLGSTFNAQAGGYQVYGTGTFHNAGDFTVNVANYIRLVWDTLNFVNTGSLDIQAGELEFRNTSSHMDATITVAGGALLDFAYYTHDLDQDTTLDAAEVSFSGATVDVAGTYRMTGSSTKVSGGTANFTGSIPNGVGDLVISGGTANFSNTEGVVSANTLTQTYGTLTGTSDVIITGLTTWDGGAIAGIDGTETITADGGIELGSVYMKSLDGRTLNYTGTANWTDGDIQLENEAVWNVTTGNTFNAQADGQQVYGIGIFNNAGDFTVNVANYVRATWNTLHFFNAGTVDVQSGELRFYYSPYTQTTGATVLNGGSIQATSAPLDFRGGLFTGSGLVTGDVHVGICNPGPCESQTAPGFLLGEVVVAGDYIQGNDGGLAIELGGLTPVAEYDRLAVSGEASLDGGLTVSSISGFSPDLGDSFVIITAGSLNGWFSEHDLPSLPDGLSWCVEYDVTEVILTVVHSVPGDHNDDSYIDLFDFRAFARCLTGPDRGPYDGGCSAFDFDDDLDVDLTDFADFELAFTDS